MISLILAHFGYAKIPKEAVQLSVMQEEFYKKMINAESDPKGKGILRTRLGYQQTITLFLRSCRF